MRALLAHAAHLGVSVHVAHITPPYRGFYDHDMRMVVYDFNLSPIERDCVLAHELGHAFYGHQDRHDQQAEDDADAYAAALLVDPDRYARLEHIGLNPDEIAEELGVNEKLLRVFVETQVTRIRGAAYSTSRMGQGQFRHAARWAV
ncbi:ImmA/IrrE family metallo-endopeptidase [Microbacterium sp. 5K110]|nr:ImmA/IrrE family metallo-endopeptidase [Microbacterium sp. 5K110]